jgi:hypothetical protein
MASCNFITIAEDMDANGTNNDPIASPSSKALSPQAKEFILFTKVTGPTANIHIEIQHSPTGADNSWTKLFEIASHGVGCMATQVSHHVDKTQGEEVEGLSLLQHVRILAHGGISDDEGNSLDKLNAKLYFMLEKN